MNCKTYIIQDIIFSSFLFGLGIQIAILGLSISETNPREIQEEDLCDENKKIVDLFEKMKEIRLPSLFARLPQLVTIAAVRSFQQLSRDDRSGLVGPTYWRYLLTQHQIKQLISYNYNNNKNNYLLSLKL